MLNILELILLQNIKCSPAVPNHNWELWLNIIPPVYSCLMETIRPISIKM